VSEARRSAVAPGDPAGYQLAYEAGVQGLREQSETLRETRDRAGALMSAAAVAGGLATGLAFSADRVHGIDWPGVLGAVVAVVGFVGVAVATVMIWRPTEARFVQDAGVIVSSYIERDPPATLSELHRELALWLGRHADSNRVVIEVRLRVFTWGFAALLVEIGGAVIALGDVARG
jgi:hypothetical protein